ncbi:hypothetical protein [Legionella jamestowniensis]|uniref:Phasin protein n=1 Tax=Legionella jamestowniensis TaxID=455 RepID=A0A0W0UGB8_9GAMM|nr:hypothetical protein [Legionella jamestowniensis]KTD06917.1 hypothetical protein Ljam_1112 [Legionella jamestowniensis]OCH97440.1 hypothetical protein A8135_02910 [Legionella jamestowniensis]SFL85141.1 hypothetical protein SAMN02746073_2256 [Legionella jamestowniensis DSM 19215]
MQQDYMENWKDAFNQLQKPFREMIELNVKTLQKIAYLKPDELSHIKKPGDILEKNVDIFIQNGHRALDYMQQAFGIFEKHLLTAARDINGKHERSHYYHH